MKRFSGSSAGKESACNAGDPGSIPGSGRSPREGNSYSLHYSCLENSTGRGAWRVTVHGVTENQTQLSHFHFHHRIIYVLCCLICVSLDISIGGGNGIPFQYSCLENPMDGGAWQAAVHGVTKSRTQLSDFTFTFHFHALEKEMATHSSVLAWRIPETGESGGLLSMGLHRAGHD